MRPIGKFVLGFGMVSIPVKVYPAVKSAREGVALNQLHAECGSRVQQPIAMRGIWREKVAECPHYHGRQDSVGVCDANEMRPCVYETSPGEFCGIFQEILREWKRESNRDYILIRLTPCYPVEEVKLMLNGQMSLPKWLLKEMGICPKCRTLLMHFSGLEEIPAYLYCPSCNDTAYNEDMEVLFNLI